MTGNVSTGYQSIKRRRARPRIRALSVRPAPSGAVEPRWPDLGTSRGRAYRMQLRAHRDRMITTKLPSPSHDYDTAFLFGGLATARWSGHERDVSSPGTPSPDPRCRGRNDR